ncbi:MAG: FAD-binding protein [Cyanobacteria bacterium RYN_339]|nr:FAD-binding protein [Cyanobacteria bacterium RYN_339]
MPRMWKNWSGGVSFTPAHRAAPADEDALRRLVLETAGRGGKLRVVGAGHSFTPLVETTDTLVSLDALTGIVEVAAPEALIKAGTRLQALGPALAAHHLAMENMGDIDTQSLAGALATGTHGTGAQLGGLATQVTGLTLLGADGEFRTCSETQDPQLFQAAKVSLGALGVVTAVRLQLVPSFRLKAVKARAHLDDILASLDGLLAGNRHFEFFWIPYTDVVQAKYLNLAQEPATPRPLAHVLNDLVLENGALWALSEAARLVPGLSRAVCQVEAAAIGGQTQIDDSYKIFATPRHVRFEEMEYALPRAALPAVIADVRAALTRGKYAVNFPIEVRFGAGDEAWLSPAHGRDTAYVAVHMYRGMDLVPYFSAMEAIFRAHGGRPHWGKRHTLGAEALAGLYPRWADFLALRQQLDPAGMFLNGPLERIFGLS